MGKIWARWGDARREAGFKPNQLQSAYSEYVLIEKFISLARELGHFPVATEVKMKARSDDSARKPPAPRERALYSCRSCSALSSSWQTISEAERSSWASFHMTGAAMFS
jgi:hypothetical protein